MTNDERMTKPEARNAPPLDQHLASVIRFSFGFWHSLFGFHLSFALSFYVLSTDGQAPDALARRREDGVGHGRSDRRNAGFARAAHLLLAGDNVRFDQGHFVDAQHRVIVKVSLFHPPVLEADLAI